MEVIGDLVSLTREEREILLDHLARRRLGISRVDFLRMMREGTLREEFPPAKTRKLRQLAQTLPKYLWRPPQKRSKKKVQQGG